ncbi:hypothetical protein EVG20_g10357 [Dentipellis fragilis]|uniref:Uncharacterized protein n=1 Tax=Dentipellis fragilis TaxID=205917 RepID=A0A4Y9XWE9_9AGAM|nr:hypothetical protein EVG20_g10357 [Dentipellis fragilis]
MLGCAQRCGVDVAQFPMPTFAALAGAPKSWSTSRRNPCTSTDDARAAHRRARLTMCCHPAPRNVNPGSPENEMMTYRHIPCQTCAAPNDVQHPCSNALSTMSTTRRGGEDSEKSDLPWLLFLPAAPTAVGPNPPAAQSSSKENQKPDKSCPTSSSKGKRSHPSDAAASQSRKRMKQVGVSRCSVDRTLVGSSNNTHAMMATVPHSLKYERDKSDEVVPDSEEDMPQDDDDDDSATKPDWDSDEEIKNMKAMIEDITHAASVRILVSPQPIASDPGYV